MTEIAMRPKRCGWPEPAASQNKNGAAICRKCHGVIVFRAAYLRWEHDRG